jgi:hypothetical protein
MQPQQQRIQLRIVTSGRGDLVDLRQPGLRHWRRVDGSRCGLATFRAGSSASLISPSSTTRWYTQRRAATRVFLRAAPATGVRAGHYVSLRPGHQLPDLPRSRLVQAPDAPVLDDPVPVRAVRQAGPGAHRRRHHWDILSGGSDLGDRPRAGRQGLHRRWRACLNSVPGPGQAGSTEGSQPRARPAALPGERANAQLIPEGTGRVKRWCVGVRDDFRVGAGQATAARGPCDVARSRTRGERLFPARLAVRVSRRAGSRTRGEPGRRSRRRRHP